MNTPEQSQVVDTEESSEDKSPQPIPAAVKFGLPVFGVLFMVVVITTVVVLLPDRSSSPAQINTAVSAPPLPQIDTIDPIDEKPPVTSSDSALPIDGAPEADKLPSVSEITEQPYAYMESDLQAYAEQVSSLNKVITELQSDLSQIQKGQQQQIERSQERLDQLSKTIELVRTELAQLKDQQKQMAHQFAEESQSQQKQINQIVASRSNRPPFSLLSVDEWGNRRQAVLDLNGSTTLANEGDVRAGWRILTISAGSIGVERLSDGLKVQLKREGDQ